MNDYLLFDLDGTLTNPKVGITTCVQYALASFGIDEPDTDKLTPFIGPPLKESFMEFYGFDEEKAAAAVEKYRERFQDTGLFENEIYDGIAEMVKKLKEQHKKLAVASSKPTVFVERILEHFQIREYFDVVVGSELDGRRTDKAEVVHETLRQLYGEKLSEDAIHEKKKNTVMIGDRKFDVEGARAEGVISVAVSYGYGEMEELKAARPDYIVRSVEELEKLLMRGSNVKNDSFTAKLWDILYPTLMIGIVMQGALFLGSFILLALLRVLPAGYAEWLVLCDALGHPASFTANGSNILNSMAFMITGVISWKLFAREDIMKAEKALLLKHSCLKKPTAYFGMVIGTLGIGIGLNLLIGMFPVFHNSDAYRQTAEQQYGAIIPLGLLLAGVIAPIAEELVFRGILFNRLKKYMSGSLAIVFSALLFGKYHQNIVQGFYGFLMGCLIAYFYESFGHFYIPVIIHILSNLAAYLLTVTGVFTVMAGNLLLCVVLLLTGCLGLLLCVCQRHPGVFKRIL